MFIKSIVPRNHTIHKPTTIILLFKCILNVQKAASVSCCLVTQLCPTLCDPIDYSTPGFLSLTISQSLLKFTSIESVMQSNHLILFRPFFLLPLIFSTIRVFSNEPALHIRWPKDWSFSFQHQSFQGIVRVDLTR